MAAPVLVALALAGGGVALAAASFSAGSYKGTTSQHESVAMKMSSAHRIASFTLTYQSKCDSGQSFGDNPTVHHANFTGKRFSGQTTYDNTNSATYLLHVTVTLSGQPTANGAKGRYSALVNVVDRASGQQVDTCRTGPITWTAKRH